MAVIIHGSEKDERQNSRRGSRRVSHATFNNGAVEVVKERDRTSEACCGNLRSEGENTPLEYLSQWMTCHSSLLETRPSSGPFRLGVRRSSYGKQAGPRSDHRTELCKLVYSDSYQAVSPSGLSPVLLSLDLFVSESPPLIYEGDVIRHMKSLSLRQLCAPREPTNNVDATMDLDLCSTMPSVHSHV